MLTQYSSIDENLNENIQVCKDTYSMLCAKRTKKNLLPEHMDKNNNKKKPGPNLQDKSLVRNDQGLGAGGDQSRHVTCLHLFNVLVHI